MKRFSLVFAVAALGLAVTASSAFAEHARPKAATPLTFRLVPAFNACLGASPPGMTHGAPLALPSCSPPTETSSFLTAQANERVAPFGPFAADATGSITLKVTCHTPGTTTEVAASPCTGIAGDQIDVRIIANSTGVRCQGQPGQTHGPHGGPLVGCAANTLYNGMVLGTSSIRITDHYSAIVPNPTGADCSDTTSCTATGQDLPFNVSSQCTGGSCNYITSSDLVVADVSKEGKRAVVGLGQIQIQDAGLDGDLVAGVPPTTGVCPPACQQTADGFAVASTQGLFVP